MSSQSANPPVLFLLAVACIAGAATLAWFSSPVTMTMTRAGDKKVAVAFESRLFGVFPRSGGRVDDVRSVSMRTFRGPGMNSDTPDRIVFNTPSEAVDLGMVQQLFVGEFGEIKTFVAGNGGTSGGGEGDGGEANLERAAPPPRALVLSSIAPGSELRRFLFAQLAVVFLTFVGLGVGYMGAKALVS